MQRIQLNSKDGLASGWIGVGDAHNLPDRVHANVPRAVRVTGDDDASDATEGKAKRGLLRSVFGFARNAAIGLALVMTVPFAAIGVLGVRFQEYDMRSQRLQTKLESSERLRAFMAPANASVTADEAGAAFRMLQTETPGAGFPVRKGDVPHVKPWRTLRITPSMFADVRNPANPSSLYASNILYKASEELSAEELGYLRIVAEAPIWKDFDRAATAPSVDLIGGLFALPFSNDAFVANMPLVRYGEMRELASAAVTRAAYHVATRDLDRAETALRTVVSFGFMLMDNASSALDATVGRSIANIGADGLVQLYTIQMREDLAAAVRVPKEFANNVPRVALKRVDTDAERARMLADVNNPALPRGVRLETLRSLSYRSCGNVREVLLGPDQAVRDAFGNAKTSLARFPSEVAYIDLMSHMTERVPEYAGARFGAERFIVGAATVAGAVLDNPRVAACTRIAMMSF